MEGILLTYALFSGSIGIVVGISDVLNESDLRTPIDIMNIFRNKDVIKIYHVLYIFGIFALVIYYISFILAFLCKKICNITIYKKSQRH